MTEDGKGRSGFEVIRTYWAVIMALSLGLLALGGLQWQTRAHAETLKQHTQDIETNEEAIEAIQRSLIRRQGEIGLDLERLKIEQNQQSEKLDDVLLLLRQLQSSPRQ